MYPSTSAFPSGKAPVGVIGKGSIMRWLLIGLCLAIGASLLACGQSPPSSTNQRQDGADPKARTFDAVREGFPTDDSRSWERIGLFIGIDHYPRIPGGNLDGCVNDALRMRDLFVERFGFERTAFLSNSEATRANISAMLRALIQQAKTAAANDTENIHVVICYAGHGSQVKDQPDGQPGHESGVSLDETWVAHDSSIDKGENDVRDDEINGVLKTLVRLGARVLLVSDSCHSGTIHRSLVKKRSVMRATPAAGPQDELFDGFVEGGRTRGEMAGFVAYTACLDSQCAYEHKDDDGDSCGRFTFVLRRLLSEMPPGTTYQGLYDAVCNEFGRLGFDSSQQPQFHASGGRNLDAFLDGRIVEIPPYATIREQIDDHHYVLDLGSVHGVAKGSGFVFYKTVDAMAARAPDTAIGRGVVTDVSALTCRVETHPDDDVLPASAKGRLTRARLADFVVRIGENIPDPLRKRLMRMDELKRLSVRDERFTAAVYLIPSAVDERPAIGVFLPDALPDAESGRGGRPIRVIPWGDPETGSKAVVDKLLYLARIRRLFTLEREPGQLEVEARLHAPADGGVWQPVERERVHGTPRLKDGDKVTLRLANHTPVVLYAYVLIAAQDDTVSVLYPGPEEDRLAVPAGGTLEIDHPTDPIVASAEAEPATYRFLVIATSTPVDFHMLVKEPGIDRPAHRGGGNPLVSLFDGVLNGNEATRSLDRTGGELTWATAAFTVTVEGGGSGGGVDWDSQDFPDEDED